MALLIQTKQNVDGQFGPSVMANNLIGGSDAFKGEEAYQYNVGDFQVTVGFYQGIGRYACFTKGTFDPEQFAPVDVETCLELIAPLGQWQSSTEQPPAAAPPVPTTGSNPGPVGSLSINDPFKGPPGSAPSHTGPAKPSPGSPSAPGGAPKPAPPPPVVIGGIGTTSDFQCTIKGANGNDVGVLGWHRTTKPYVFVYCPLMAPPQPAIAASPMVIDANFGQV